MIFVDTWAWIALADKRDAYHRKAKAQHKKFSRARRRYVTTDYILSETITYLYDAVGPSPAQGFITTLLAAADAGTYLFVHLAPPQFRRAWDLRQKYDDKPDISFVDFTSMVVMQELGIVDIFTGDAHFQQVNLGFRLFPWLIRSLDELADRQRVRAGAAVLECRRNDAIDAVRFGREN